jgi:predicted transcriptional regulator
MHEHIQSNPGVNKIELHRRVGIGWGTMIYNVDVLTELGKIKTFDDRGNVRLFDSFVTRDEMQFFASVRMKHSDSIIATLSEQGQIQAYKIADDIGVSRKVVRRTIGYMHKHGFLERTGQVKPQYSLTEKAKNFLSRLN